MKEVCQILTLRGQVVQPSENARIFIRGCCMISLSTFIGALEEAGVEQVVLYAYGMKAHETMNIRLLTEYKVPRNPIVPCRWDFGNAAEVEGGNIPLYHLKTCSWCSLSDVAQRFWFCHDRGS